MDLDTFLMVAFAVLIGLFLIIIFVGLPRGKRMQDTNQRIAENQERQIAPHERQTAAIERIADAMERRGDG